IRRAVLGARVAVRARVRGARSIFLEPDARSKSFRVDDPRPRRMRIEKKSPFRMGWIMAMFDLPVMTDKERKSATRVRNDLLDNGYLMIQFSVYARPCVTYEQMELHIARIKG